MNIIWNLFWESIVQFSGKVKIQRIKFIKDDKKGRRSSSRAGEHIVRQE